MPNPTRGRLQYQYSWTRPCSERDWTGAARRPLIFRKANQATDVLVNASGRASSTWHVAVYERRQLEGRCVSHDDLQHCVQAVYVLHSNDLAYTIPTGSQHLRPCTS